MANYEKQVEQEAAYPIPISLYNCYRTVRQEKRGIAIHVYFRAHQSVKTWFLNLVVTRNVFSKCPRHCAFVSVSNAHARD